MLRRTGAARGNDDFQYNHFASVVNCTCFNIKTNDLFPEKTCFKLTTRPFVKGLTAKSQVAADAFLDNERCKNACISLFILMHQRSRWSETGLFQ